MQEFHCWSITAKIKGPLVWREREKENKQEILIPLCGTLHHKLFPNSLQFWLTQVAAYLSWRETCKAAIPWGEEGIHQWTLDDK